jgi:hypothetical protein
VGVGVASGSAVTEGVGDGVAAASGTGVASGVTVVVGAGKFDESGLEDGVGDGDTLGVGIGVGFDEEYEGVGELVGDRLVTVPPEFNSICLS